MSKSISKFFPAILMLVLLFVTVGYEANGAPHLSSVGYKYLGWPINDLYSSKIGPGDGPILIRPNKQGYFASEGTGNYRPLTATEMNFVLQSVTEAVETLNAIPDTYLRFQVGDWVERDYWGSFTDNDNYIPVTWIDDGIWGQCTTTGGSVGNTRTRGMLVNFSKFQSTGPSHARMMIISEVLHLLGEDHSPITYSLTLEEYGIPSLGAYNARDYSNRVIPPTPLLHYDDFAWVAYHYPAETSNFNTGNIEGEVVDSSGNPIFGANVFAVNADGVAMLGTISGFHDFTGTASAHGKFILPRLTPGTYDIVITSLTNTRFPIDSTPWGRELRKQFHSFENYWSIWSLVSTAPEFTIVRNVTVTSQIQRDLGQITLSNTVGTYTTASPVRSFYLPCSVGSAHAKIKVNFDTDPRALQYIVTARRTDGDGTPLQYWVKKPHTTSGYSTFDALTPPSHIFTYITQPGRYQFDLYFHDGTRYERIGRRFLTATAGTNSVHIVNW